VAGTPLLAQDGGTFQGKVVVEWLEDGAGPDREMKVLEPFSFTDKRGVSWPVPAGAVINGASIPRAFWDVVGSPFVGDYRRASVVHDHYCTTKERTWQAVHRMFYDGMIAAGLPVVQAKVLYGAVYAGGPRWSGVRGAEPGAPQLISVMPEFSADELRELQRRIETANPELYEVERMAQEMAQP
jgi:hypothetical protein